MRSTQQIRNGTSSCYQRGTSTTALEQQQAWQRSFGLNPTPASPLAPLHLPPSLVAGDGDPHSTATPSCTAASSRDGSTPATAIDLDANDGATSATAIDVDRVPSVAANPACSTCDEGQLPPAFNTSIAEEFSPARINELLALILTDFPDAHRVLWEP